MPWIILPKIWEFSGISKTLGFKCWYLLIWEGEKCLLKERFGKMLLMNFWFGVQPLSQKPWIGWLRGPDVSIWKEMTVEAVTVCASLFSKAPPLLPLAWQGRVLRGRAEEVCTQTWRWKTCRGLPLLFYRAVGESLAGTPEFFFFLCFCLSISLFLLLMGEFSLQDKLAYVI